MNALKELRKSKKLNQKDVADYLGITQQAYQKYEYGTSEMSGSTISKLANFYGVTTDYLLGRESNIEIDIVELVTRVADLTPFEKEIFELCISSTRQQRAEMATRLATIVKDAVKEFISNDNHD